MYFDNYPSHNRTSLLPLTLDSMLAQDYPADCAEILLGSDNSPDATEAVVEEYARREPCIRPFFESRQGLHYVRNRAAYIANRDILYWTDDDVISDPALIRV